MANNKPVTKKTNNEYSLIYVFNEIKKILKSFNIGFIDLLFAAIFSSVLVVGYILSSSEMIDAAPMDTKSKIAYVFGSLIISGIILFGLLVLKKMLLKFNRESQKKVFKQASNIKLWLIVSGAILLFYIPIFTLGLTVLTPDSWSSIRQSINIEVLSNHHPVIFTTFVNLFIHIGLLFNNLQLGIILFSIIQSTLLAMIFGAVIVWMRNANIGINGIVAAFIYYAIFPINAVAGIIMWKDILFAGIGLLLLIYIRKLYIEKQNFFNNKNVLFFISLAFIFCIWRNNGFYTYLLFCIIAIVFNYKIFLGKKFLILMLTPILLFTFYSVFIFSISKPSELSESLSVPIQQIARTVKYHGSSLSENDKSIINEVLPYDQLSTKYNNNFSDPVKFSFNNEAFKKDPSKYFKLWLKLFFSYKKTYVAAFVYNTYGYVYPYRVSPSLTDSLTDNSMNFNAIKDYPDLAYINGNKRMLDNYNDLVTSTIPLIRNIGFYTFILLLSAYSAIIKKRHELQGVFILLLSLFITTILGPINGEFRYLYLFVLATPFVIASIFSDYPIKKSRHI